MDKLNYVAFVIAEVPIRNKGSVQKVPTRESISIDKVDPAFKCM